VQENCHAREPNHEHGSMPEALCLDPTRKVRSHRMDEDGHSCTLHGQRQGAEDGDRKSLVEKVHRSWLLVQSRTRSFLLRQAASSPAFTGQDDCQCDECHSTREASFPRNAFKNGGDYGLISGTCISCTSIARPSRQSI